MYYYNLLARSLEGYVMYEVLFSLFALIFFILLHAYHVVIL